MLKDKTLVIVESPSKCKKIEQYLGKRYKVMASFGHFTKLDDLKQIDFNTFDIKYKISNQKIIKQLREAIKVSDDVIIATDDDREGESIGWTICNFCKLDPMTTKKISFQEVTKSAILKSLENIHSIDMNRVRSQQTRQILDIYLGYKISPMLWKYVQHKLSAGRCQTPALKLVYDNQKEIDGMNKETEYKVNANFTSKHILFSLTSCVSKNDISQFLENIKEQLEWTVHDIKMKPILESPPNILITSSLQQKAANILNFSPKMTMKCAQELYENGYITYMRTDSSCYSKDFIMLLKQHIERSYGDKYINDNIQQLSMNKANGKSQEAHEGIRVCELNISETKFNNSSTNRLYKLIYKHTIQCGMAPSTGQDFEYFIKYPTAQKEYLFKYKEHLCLFDGWKKLENLATHTTFRMYLDILYETQKKFKLSVLYAKEKLIQNLKHLSEASLIQQLEKRNIGRPSTFSNIIQSLQDKKYTIKGNIEGIKTNITNYTLNTNKTIEQQTCEAFLNCEKSKLQITPIGKQVCEFCFEHFNDLFTYEFTNIMENSLDKIETTELQQNNVLNNYINIVDSLIEETKATYLNEPEKIKKVKDVSLYCGIIYEHVAYIKSGKYGYYLNYGTSGKSKISLKEFDGFDIEQKIDSESDVSEDNIQSLINFIDKNEGNKKKNMLVELNSDYSIRQSKFGFYIYYKTKKMKQPKFLKYNDEKDNNVDLRQTWVVEKNITQIKNYIQQKYNVSI